MKPTFIEFFSENDVAPFERDGIRKTASGTLFVY